MNLAVLQEATGDDRRKGVNGADITLRSSVPGGPTYRSDDSCFDAEGYSSLGSCGHKKLSTVVQTKRGRIRATIPTLPVVLVPK